MKKSLQAVLVIAGALVCSSLVAASRALPEWWFPVESRADQWQYEPNPRLGLTSEGRVARTLAYAKLLNDQKKQWGEDQQVRVYPGWGTQNYAPTKPAFNPGREIGPWERRNPLRWDWPTIDSLRSWWTGEKEYGAY